MTVLYESQRHEPLTHHAWAPETANAEILRIVRDVSASALPGGGWPLHPLDAESYRTKKTKWCLYGGAAGVVIGSEILRREGYPAPDLRAQLPKIYENYLRAPDVDTVEPGLQLGEIGILAPAVLVDVANDELSARLDQCMAQTVNHEAREITSGPAGMMHAALALYRATGEDRWKERYRQGADALWRSWNRRPGNLGWLWENKIFGQNRSYYGAGHGIAGNANVLLLGADLLAGEYIEPILERTAETLDRAAVREPGMANWHASAPPFKGKLFVQWCHGAPGIVTALGHAPRMDTPSCRIIDRLLLQASALVWHAGPLTKGASLCHGTAGNGYAFLAMYERTGEQKWLEKARKFAAHAIHQCQRDRQRFGQGRHSLMTGDAGLAVYLHHCLKPSDIRFPGLELFA